MGTASLPLTVFSVSPVGAAHPVILLVELLLSNFGQLRPAEPPHHVGALGQAPSSKPHRGLYPCPRLAGEGRRWLGPDPHLHPEFPKPASGSLGYPCNCEQSLAQLRWTGWSVSQPWGPGGPCVSTQATLNMAGMQGEGGGARPGVQSLFHSTCL